MGPEEHKNDYGDALNTQLANDKYRAIIDSIDEGFCLIEIILNEEGKPVDLVYLETNRIFQLQSGLGEVIGRRLRDLVPGIEQVWIDFYGNVALTGEPARQEYFVEALGRWFSAYASRVGGSNYLQVAVVFDDITERKQRERRQEYLLKLNDALRSLGDPDEIEGAVTQIAMEYFGADRIYYCEIEGDNAVIKQDAVRGDLPSVAGTYPISSFTIFKKVVDNGKPFIVHDANTSEILDEPLRTLCLQLKVISFIDVPVIKNGRAVGILCVVQSAPRKWSQAEIELAVETAERIWAAVERACAEEALRKSEAWLNGQKQAFQAAMNGHPLAVSLGVLVKMVVAETTGDARAAFFRVPPGGEGLYHIVGMGEEYAKVVNGFMVGPDSLACGLAMHIGEAVITPDVEADPRWKPWLAITRAYNYRGCWSFPVQTDGGPVLGTFSMYFREPREPKPRELELARVVTHAAAIIISRHNEQVERTQAEAALRKNEARLASVFKVLPVGLGFIDKEGKFLLMNEAMQRFTPNGKMPSMDDRNFHRWIAYGADGKLVERHNYPAARALRGDPIPYLEMIYEQEDGQQVWTRVASLPFKNENDEIIGAVIVITDINELKRSERELIKNAQQLKALLKQKDEFIGVASHELKTPVTSMKAYAELVQDMLGQAGLGLENDIMKRLNAQIDRLTLLINDLLDTTKISEGKLNFRFEPADINELLTERIEEIRMTTTRKIDLHLQQLPLVNADKDRIGQVIINLLTNAIKYSPQGSVVTINTSCLANGIKVSVQDAGYGIAEEELLKIFDRFYRVTADHLDTYPGMGLGLYISAQIIERHGGTLEVKSTPGKGSIFFFTLPYAKVEGKANID